MIEELAVGAQFNLPYIHVLVNNAYLGLIRQSQRGFDMDYCVQLSFDNVNAPEAERLRRGPRQGRRRAGLQGDPRVRAGGDPARRFEQAKKLMAEFRVPVVVEVILERVTNISMGTEIDNVIEFESLAARGIDAPTAIIANLDYPGPTHRTFPPPPPLPPPPPHPNGRPGGGTTTEGEVGPGGGVGGGGGGGRARPGRPGGRGRPPGPPGPRAATPAPGPGPKATPPNRPFRGGRGGGARPRGRPRRPWRWGGRGTKAPGGEGKHKTSPSRALALRCQRADDPGARRPDDHRDTVGRRDGPARAAAVPPRWRRRRARGAGFGSAAHPRVRRHLIDPRTSCQVPRTPVGLGDTLP